MPDSCATSWTSIYAELRILAAHLLSRERVDHTLQPTALVHELFLRLGRDRRFVGAPPAEVLAHAARAMRDVLVEHARRKRASKRGGGARREPLDDALAAYDQQCSSVLELHEALEALARVDAALARVVELRFFGGLTEGEAAEVLGVSTRTVRRAWRTARLWLWHRLGGSTDVD